MTIEKFEQSPQSRIPAAQLEELRKYASNYLGRIKEVEAALQNAHAALCGMQAAPDTLPPQAGGGAVLPWSVMWLNDALDWLDYYKPADAFEDQP